MKMKNRLSIIMLLIISCVLSTLTPLGVKAASYQSVKLPWDPGAYEDGPWETKFDSKGKLVAYGINNGCDILSWSKTKQYVKPIKMSKEARKLISCGDDGCEVYYKNKQLYAFCSTDENAGSSNGTWIAKHYLVQVNAKGKLVKKIKLEKLLFGKSHTNVDTENVMSVRDLTVQGNICYLLMRDHYDDETQYIRGINMKTGKVVYKRAVENWYYSFEEKYLIGQNDDSVRICNYLGKNSIKIPLPELGEDPIFDIQKKKVYVFSTTGLYAAPIESDSTFTNIPLGIDLSCYNGSCLNDLTVKSQKEFYVLSIPGEDEEWPLDLVQYKAQ